MAEYTGDLLKIYNGTGEAVTFQGTRYPSGSFVTLSKFQSYTVEFNKLWSSDTGRSMTGENKGTLIGIFPKIKVKLGVLGDSDMNAILLLTSQATTQITYYDGMAKSLKTADFYFGDMADEFVRKASLKRKPKDISAIAIRKRE